MNSNNINGKTDGDTYDQYKICQNITSSQSWPYEVEFDRFVKKRNYCSTTVNRMTSMINSRANSNSKKLPSGLKNAEERVQSTTGNSSMKNILNLSTKSFPMKSLFLNNCNIVYNFDNNKQDGNNKSGLSFYCFLLAEDIEEKPGQNLDSR